MVAGDKPSISQTKSARTAAREAFFLDFAKETRKRFPNLVLMLTGGFRSRAGAESAIKENACDLVGIARPAAVNPRFAALLLDEGTRDEDAQISLDKVRPGWLPTLLRSQILGAGAESVSFIFLFLTLGNWRGTAFLTGIDLLCRPDSSVGQGSRPRALIGLLLCIT